MGGVSLTIAYWVAVVVAVPAILVGLSIMVATAVAVGGRTPERRQDALKVVQVLTSCLVRWRRRN